MDQYPKIMTTKEVAARARESPITVDEDLGPFSHKPGPHGFIVVVSSAARFRDQNFVTSARAGRNADKPSCKSTRGGHDSDAKDDHIRTGIMSHTVKTLAHGGAFKVARLKKGLRES